MHVGHPGNIDLRYTVTRRRTFSEIIDALPPDAPELQFFEHDMLLRRAFPEGDFNCWGVPSKAEPSFEKTQIGDLVLFVPSIGIHRDAGVHQIGVVNAKCPIRAFHASRVLWPETPNERLFPWLFFFNTEVGVRGWFEFLEDVDIKPNWDPRGWYRPIGRGRFRRWGGPEGYLGFLRNECGFKPLR